MINCIIKNGYFYYLWIFLSSNIPRIQIFNEILCMCHNPQFETSRNVFKKLFDEKYFDEKSATEIVSKALEMELMSSFGNFEKKSNEIKKQENQNDFPLVSKLSKVIDTDTRLVIVSEKVADDVKNYRSRYPIDIIKNSVQIRSFKIKSSSFKSFCVPIHSDEEIYQWKGKYDGNFLGYMKAIVPLIKMGRDGFGII